jgi:hypothetical protein
LQIKTKIVSCHTADSKPVKQEVNSTMILPLLVFPGSSLPLLEMTESILKAYITGASPELRSTLGLAPGLNHKY